MRMLMIGSGFVAPYHLAGWRRLGVEITGIVTKDRARGEVLARENGTAHVFDDVETALEATKPDVVDIASPLEWHVAHIELAAHARAAILCQKPLAPTLAEAGRAARAVRQAGVRLRVHENFRFRPWYRAARRVLAAGTIGEAFYLRSDLRFAGTVSTSLHPDRPYSIARQPYFAEAPRLLTLDSVIHQIDVARFLVGEPDLVFAQMRRVSDAVRGEDVASLAMRFGRLHAVIERSYASKGYPDPPVASEDLVVEGTAGTLRVDRDGRVSVHIDGAGGRHVTEIAVERVDAYPASYAATIAHFHDCIRSGAPFETGLDDNLRTLDAALAAYVSAESGIAVALPTPDCVALLAIHH
ncbi:MAG: Gfo/Idh/MocA family oxidoreductase [Hyphomicrobiaceae bacterium]